jgi:hypothetical protein
MSRLYQSELVIIFPADDIDHADERTDEVIELLEEHGFTVEGGIVEESIALSTE